MSSYARTCMPAALPPAGPLRSLRPREAISYPIMPLPNESDPYAPSPCAGSISSPGANPRSF